MVKVTYLLGAGFSAPLGLPLTSNFVPKAKQVVEPESIDALMSKFAKIQIYYNCDLFNIEELLSIAEVESHFEDNRVKEDLTDMICKVIESYTPELGIHTEFDKPNYNFLNYVFWGPYLNLEIYGAFISSIFGFEFIHAINKGNNKLEREIKFLNEDIGAAKYSIITLNYDMVLENFISFLKKLCKRFGIKLAIEEELKFNTRLNSVNWNIPTLAKLHGSIDAGTIIPPSHFKGRDPLENEAWGIAYKLLAETNHLRILGYSLPEADNYIRYLLKGSVLKSVNLDSIHVICFDNDGMVEKRYKDLIKYTQDYIFLNDYVENYFMKISDLTDVKTEHTNSYQLEIKRFDKLEEAHKRYFSLI